MSSIKSKALDVTQYMENVGYPGDHDPIFARDLKCDIESSSGPTLAPQIKSELLDFLVERLEKEIDHGTSPPELQNIPSWTHTWQLIQTGAFDDLEKEALHVLSDRGIYVKEHEVTGILHEIDSDGGSSFPVTHVRANSVMEAVEATKQRLKRHKEQYISEHGLSGEVGVDAQNVVFIKWNFEPLGTGSISPRP
jgi:hypothetical protein